MQVLARSCDTLGLDAKMEVTKCVTIHTFKPERLPSSADKWVNCFNVASPAMQPLNTKCELESANVSHLLLCIDVPDQQPYHLPMLITPIFCVYLVTFDLREQESLTRIHCVMKNVYTLSSYRKKVNQLPKVLLVGMYADKVVPANRERFAQNLNEMLKKMPYDRLVDRPDGGDPFWTVDGGDLCLSSSDCLSRQIQLYSSMLSIDVRQWISRHYELQKKLEDTPCPCYNELAEVACLSSDPKDRTFEDFIQFLHNYGFIFCHSVEEGAKADPVVLLRPQYLCTLFAEVWKLSKKRNGFTVADLLSSTAKSEFRDSAKLKHWFQRICIDMGLVVQVRCDYVFLMTLEPGPPRSPHRNEYSIPPLLMSFMDSNHFTMAHEYLLPSHFFAAFATEVLKALNPNQLPDIKQHYMVIRMANALIHIVDRGFCIEIGLQKVDVGSKRLTDKVKVKNLHKFCKEINSAVVKSSEDAVSRLNLAESSIRYGFYSTPEVGNSSDSFGAYVFDEQEGSFLNCSCCCSGLHPTTPLQRIWYEESAVEEVSVQTVSFKNGQMKIMKLLDVTSCGSEYTDSPNPPNSDSSGATNKVQKVTLTAQEVLSNLRERFIEEVDATVIVRTLEHKGVISDGNQKEVTAAHGSREQNEILHGHLKRTCNVDALKDVCHTMIKVSGNPRMNSFGRDMLSKLST